jgi:tetratricopeptide (TPR) repeat protein
MNRKSANHSKKSKPEALFRKAQILQDAGKWAEAMQHYIQVLTLQPDHIEACYSLGQLYEQQNQIQMALNSYFQALAIRYNFYPAHFSLGEIFYSLGRTSQAIDCYRKTLDLNPEHIKAHFQVAFLLQSKGDLASASEHYLKVIELDPQWDAPYTNLGLICKIEGELDEAITWYRQALERNPKEQTVFVNLAVVLEEKAQLDEAENLYMQVLSIQPDNLDALAGYASILEKKQDYQSAYALLSPAIQTSSSNVRVATSFALICQRLSLSSEALEPLTSILKQPIPLHNRVLVLFRLASVLDSLSMYDDAFYCIQEAYSLQSPPFSLERWIADIESIINVFSAENLRHLPRATNTTARPVFIVGMPRSGTSLVEQILSSHPAVTGAGELKSMYNLVGSIQNYPSGIMELGIEELDQLANKYLEHLRCLDPTAKRITDKLPQNYLNLGLISLLFPKARIIHCYRDPLDTCLSCYLQNFGSRNPYTTDLRNLGFVYKQYERMMAHWQAAIELPIFQVQYEQLIAKPEAVSRALVDFCGLDWDDRCLRFYENKRFINTASYDQVRQPIYDRSVGRARHYEKHLQTLKKALRI